MRKKIVIGVITAVIITLGSSYYFYEQKLQQEKLAQEQEEANKPKPTDYCLLTYEESADNGKTWQKIYVFDGKTPTFKAKCWKEYINIIDQFPPTTDTDGHWYTKTKDNKLLANPSMKISDKPINLKTQQDDKKSKNNTTNKPKKSK
ncbi:MAG: hypothetical protein Kow0076_0930 [Francisella sp.]